MTFQENIEIYVENQNLLNGRCKAKSQYIPQVKSEHCRIQRKFRKICPDLQDDAEHRTVTDTEKQSWNDRRALTITYGGKTHTYDGSEAIAITIETGGIERIEKLATDTTVTLEPNKLYVFPEMESLTYTIGEGTGEVHFILNLAQRLQG